MTLQAKGHLRCKSECTGLQNIKKEVSDHLIFQLYEYFAVLLGCALVGRPACQSITGCRERVVMLYYRSTKYSENPDKCDCWTNAVLYQPAQSISRTRMPFEALVPSAARPCDAYTTGACNSKIIPISAFICWTKGPPLMCIQTPLYMECDMGVATRSLRASGNLC